MAKKINPKKLAEVALNQVDQAGILLDRVGLSNNINRHTVLAYAFDQQKRLEGQRESIETIVGNNLYRAKSRIISIKEAGEDRQRALINRVDTTVQYVRERIGA